MDRFLHSLPWTLALALAQAGDATALFLPADDTAQAAVEDGLTPGESAPPPPSIGLDAGAIDLTLED